MERTTSAITLRAWASALAVFACSACMSRIPSDGESEASTTQAALPQSDTSDDGITTSDPSTADTSAATQASSPTITSTSAASSSSGGGDHDTGPSSTSETSDTWQEPTGKEFYECFYLKPMDCGENRACVPYDPQMHGEFSGLRCVDSSAPLTPGTPCFLDGTPENGQDGACGSGLICAVDPEQPLAEGVCVRVEADLNEPGCNFRCDSLFLPICLGEVGCNSTEGFCGVAGCGTITIF